MELPTNLHRFSVQECLDLAPLPTNDSNPSVKRYMSRQPAWKPGNDLPWGKVKRDPTVPRKFEPSAFGGHVYAQAPLAAARVVEKEDESAPVKGKLAIHSIQGVFTNPGLTDRPYIYEVSNVTSSRSFSTRMITARQPQEPSSNPSGPFPESDGQLPPGDAAFTCLTTFKRPVEGPSEVQETLSPQQRYAAILGTRAPDEWEHSPQVDIDLVRKTFPLKGHGSFPMLDMYKVDMTAFNADKPPNERRQLIYYRLHKPLPEEDVNAHIVTHAYEADRNGLIMLANHLGYGYKMGPVASLSYSFYVHVNGEDAVMKGDGWWIQEIGWPRISAGRGMQEARLWSPDGKHVATGYQDGMVLPAMRAKTAKM